MAKDQKGHGSERRVSADRLYNAFQNGHKENAHVVMQSGRKVPAHEVRENLDTHLENAMDKKGDPDWTPSKMSGFYRPTESSFRVQHASKRPRNT